MDGTDDDDLAMDLLGLACFALLLMAPVAWSTYRTFFRP